MKKTTSQEHVGELFLLGYLPIAGLFPILTNYMTKLMPPLLFAGMSLLLGSFCLFLYMLITKNLHLIWKSGGAFNYVLLTTLLNIVIPFILIFIGSSLTSGINTAMLSQTELLFTFLVCGIVFHEKITFQKIIGAACILIGATSILLNGKLSLNTGDLLIVAATVFFPFGNRYSKKALSMTSPVYILFVRNVLGGAVLTILSMLFERSALLIPSLVSSYLLLILLNGFVIHGISKLFWFEGLKRLDITKAISIVIAVPAFSLIYAFLFLKEIPTVYQWIGFVVIGAGLFIVTRERNPHLVEIA